MNLDWTNIILGAMTLISTGGWIVNRRKYKLDLSTDFVERFRELIAQPLEDEVMKLRTEINQLRDAIEKINDCPYSGHCPVRAKLRKQSHGD